MLPEQVCRLQSPSPASRRLGLRGPELLLVAVGPVVGVLVGTASPEFASMGSSLGLSYYPVDCYVDDQRRLRRIVMKIEPKPGSAGASTIRSESVTMGFYDFGSADTSALKAPPADQTIDISQAPDLTSNGIFG